MARVWSTAQFKPKDRIAYWIDAVCGTFVHFGCTLRSNAPFFGEISDDRIGPLQIGTATSVGQSLVRSSHEIERAPAELCFIGVQQQGRGYVEQDGRATELQLGDFFLIDSTRPHELRFNDKFSQVIVHIPRQLLKQYVTCSERFTAVRIDGSTGIGGLLSPLLRDLPRRLPQIPVVMHQRVSENLLNLVALALASVDDPASTPTVQTLVRVKMWIELHLEEALSAERIAAGCKISVRHLNRLFASEGTSLMAHVQNRRLMRCHRDLTDPTLRSRSISEIAFAAGFSDLSHFSRAYRTRYGCAARDTRAQLQPND
jgi:AraC-like DNA-binding protein